MSTEVAVIESNTFLALQEGGEIREAIEANASTGEDITSLITKVKIPSAGQKMWVIPRVDKDQATDAIEGVLVGYLLRGVIWNTQGQATEGARPAFVCNGKSGVGLAEGEASDPSPEMLKLAEPYRLASGKYDWQKMTGGNYPDCPFGWGSAVDSSGKPTRGKAAKEQRIIFIALPDDPFPLQINLGPGQLGDKERTLVKPFVTGLGRIGIPHYRAMVRLTLQPHKSSGGTTYSRVHFELVGQLSREDGLVFKRIFTDRIHAVASNLDVDADGFDD